MPIKTPSVSIACVCVMPETTSLLGIKIVFIELIIVISTELAHIGMAIRDISDNIFLELLSVRANCVRPLENLRWCRFEGERNSPIRTIFARLF